MAESEHTQAPALDAPLFATILCADWSKGVKGREVYRADVNGRAVRREKPPKPPGNWTVISVIARAEALREEGPVLVAFDAPIGVPSSYLHAATRKVGDWKGCETFPDWIVKAVGSPGFFDESSESEAWCFERPFFTVPKGEGTKSGWESRLRSLGVDPFRTIDRRTGAKSPFIVNLPGSVGGATRDLWQGLVPFLTGPASISLWPFHGDLAELAKHRRVVVGEIYPRAAYALALSAEAPATRKPLALSKNKCSVRRKAVDDLTQAPWVQDHRVSLCDIDRALDSADAFDALLTAAGLLRCVLEETPLSAASLEDPVEGGILGCGSLVLQASVGVQPMGFT